MLMRHSVAMYLLGVLFWVMSLHSGTFNSALAPIPKHKFTDFDKSAFFYPNTIDQLPQLDMKITAKDLNKTVTFATGIVNRLRTLETNLGWSNIHVKHGSPSHGQLIDSEPEIEALRQGRNALIAIKATMHLMYIHCSRINFNSHECAEHISHYKLLSTPLHSACPSVSNMCTKDEFDSNYRSLDGSCNNMYDGLRGKAFTSYKRLLPAAYLDGVQQMRRSVNKKFALPSPRLISTSVYRHHDDVDNELTLAVMQWSQFIEHDLAHTAISKMIHSSETIECCDSDGTNLLPRYIHPFCASISIPEDDVFYSNYNLECMSYVRSIAAMRSDCSLGALEQMNQATHFLDGSQIYGSHISKIIKLRKFRGGLLHTSKNQAREFLPISPTPEEHCQYNSPNSLCFISGDSRVNAYPQLTAIHTIWHREHNRIAGELAILNPHWDDEILYQEAKRLVVAEIQHITYNEWLPVFLGKKYVAKIYSNDLYSEFADPAVANSFANAAMKVFNSLIQDNVRLYLENRKVNMSLHLREHFNKPLTIEVPGHLDSLIRGLATQHSQKLDTNLVEDITSQLYKSGDYGFDVLSLDIQRGRDHGLPSYSHYRHLCGLPKLNHFTDLLDLMNRETVDSLKNVYRSPQDIDLLVGGLSEIPDDDSLVGPTFSCIIADQMLRTKRGDRYFYTNTEQPKPFSKEQLVEIEKVTLARIFCDNGDDILTMQSNVFKKIDQSNNLLSCLNEEDIPFMNLKLWTERQY